MHKKTNANPPAIPSARASQANTPAAAVSSSPASLTNTADVAPPEFEPKAPPPFASDRWAAGGASSSDEEEDVKKTTSKKGAAPAKKKSGRPKGKDRYLAARPAEKADPDFMPGGAPGFDADDDALPPAAFDPFADESAASGAAGAGAGDDGRVHLRVQQRNGRKTLTTVQGLSTGYNYAKVLRDLKRELCCNGTVVEDKELGNVIQLQGDHRKKVAAFLAKAGLAKTDCIKVHGF